MKTRIPALAAALTALALLLAACGGDEEGRPTKEEISESFQEDSDAGEGLPEAQADCIAEAYVSSDISDEGLRAIGDAGDEVESVDDLDISQADKDAHDAVLEEATACITGG
jgi:hypothetical protein